MYSHQITAIAGPHRKRKRVGRGRGSGHGKTCGRGSKGALSRSGATRCSLKEGGQMPLFRRLPKRGFSNALFGVDFQVVNVGRLEAFEDGAEVTIERLLEAGLINKPQMPVKVLGDGRLTKKLTVYAHKFSRSAQDKITSCGGEVKVLPLG
ncbi:MAG: 50S ribosomal protein L15 [Sedimentisphaerales bacterium]|nr:50S ribosomal protein L15 [Sedimentisphaerales bacterium]